MRLLCTALMGLAAVATCAAAASVAQDFTVNPAHDGWALHGDASLFAWDSVNGRLNVTWDSSRTNSYFHRPLGTVLTKSDDFSLAFDVWLNDIAIGVDPQKPETFQLAIGLIDLSQATRTNFLRGTGIGVNGARSVVEFNYFPDSGYGETVSPTIVSSNNQFASAFSFPYAMDPGALFRVTMTYTAATRTLATVMTRNGAPFGPINSIVLGGSFTDFRVDSVAIQSYSDAGQSPPQFAGSLLAHGWVDNVVVVTPHPPVTQLAQMATASAHAVSFLSRSDWVYTLLRSETLTQWTALNATAIGNGAVLALTDTNPPPSHAFYRVLAERP